MLTNPLVSVKTPFPQQVRDRAVVIIPDSITTCTTDIFSDAICVSNPIKRQIMSDLIPHGVCLASSPEIIGLIVFSNFSIALAYLVIPGILAITVWRFRIPVPAIKALFGVFIIGCGGTYVMDIVTMYLGGNRYGA